MITRSMLISDILCMYPESVTVFERLGLPCGKCLAAGMESLESVATVHDVSLELILDDLNALASVLDESSRGE